MPCHPFRKFQNTLPNPSAGSGEALQRHLEKAFDQLYPNQRKAFTPRWKHFSSVAKGSCLKNALVRFYFLAMLPSFGNIAMSTIFTEACKETSFRETDLIECYPIRDDNIFDGQLFPSTFVIWFCSKEYFGSPGISSQRTRDIFAILTPFKYIGIGSQKERIDDNSHKKTRNQKIFFTMKLIEDMEDWLFNRPFRER